ncbi:MAG: nucleoside monophosphate kinase, partial [Planctomycetes bacterium]|nr:nucleoside monophosphate kinase [Planctomycetota bacterium]
TMVQVECVRLLYNKMHELRRQFFDSPIGPLFRRPIFRITVLYVREQVSIERQINRGHIAQEHNQKVQDTGEGEIINIRKTDLDDILAKERYDVFKRQTFDALNSLRDNFHYHFVDANRTVAEVEQSIQEDFQYQSLLELGEDTYDSIHNIPLAEELVLHTRQKMVRRLDNFRHRHAEKFAKIVSLIEEEIVPILKRQAASGRARIRLAEAVLDGKHALDMLVDVLNERGYSVTTDRIEETVPVRIDAETQAIITATRHIYLLDIQFHANHIRR